MKICPKCHAQQLDEAQERCKNCDARFISLADTVYLDKSQLNEIADDILKSPRLILSMLLLVFAFGIGVYEVAESKVSKSIQETKEKTDEQLAMAYGEMTNRIAREFEEPRIKETMIEVATSQATNLMVAQLGPQIENFRVGTSNTLIQFGESLKRFQQDSTNALNDVRQATEFGLLEANAYADSYDAFASLIHIANDPNSPFWLASRQIVASIIAKELMEPARLDSMSFAIERTGLHPDKMSIGEFRQALELRVFDTNTKLFLLKTLFSENRFSKSNRLDLLITIIQSDPSIAVKNEAMYLLRDECDLGAQLDALNKYRDWWSANQYRYTNNPTK